MDEPEHWQIEGKAKNRQVLQNQEQVAYIELLASDIKVRGDKNAEVEYN